MPYENNTGLKVHNQYGPRQVGGSQGVHKTEGYRFEYVVDQPSVLPYLFPRGGGVFVTGHDVTYVGSGTVTDITIGGVSVFAATESAPVKIPDTNTGEVVVVGLTEGRVVVSFKKSAGFEEDKLPNWPGAFDPLVSISVTPATVTLSMGGTKTQQLAVAANPTTADGAVVYSTSDATKATVSASGLITAIAIGTATITATSVADGTKTDTCVVTVTA